jgi:hypothetical protein
LSTASRARPDANAKSSFIPMRKKAFIFIGAVAGSALDFLVVAWFVVANRIGGEMRAIPALEFGLILGVPVGGFAGAILGRWLARSK